MRSGNAHRHFTMAILCGIGKKSAVRLSSDTRLVRACAVEMHADISQEPFCGIDKKSAIHKSCDTRFVRACAVEMHTDISQVTSAILCWKLQGKCRTRLPAPAFCASLRNPNAHGHFTSVICLEICKENASDTTSNTHRAFRPTVRTPQCDHTVWGRIESAKYLTRPI